MRSILLAILSIFIFSSQSHAGLEAGFQLGWRFEVPSGEGDQTEQRFFAEICYLYQETAKSLSPDGKNFDLVTYWNSGNPSKFNSPLRGYIEQNFEPGASENKVSLVWPMAVACRVALEIVESEADLQWKLSQGEISESHPGLAEPNLQNKVEMAEMLMVILLDFMVTTDNMSYEKVVSSGGIVAMMAQVSGQIPILETTSRILIAKEMGIFDAMAELEAIYGNNDLFNTDIMEKDIIQLPGDNDFQFFYDIGQ